MERIKKVWTVVVSFILVISIWEMVVLTGRYESSLLPSPFKVLEGIGELIKDGTLATHFQISLLRFLIGYLAASVAGIVLGLIFGSYNKIWVFVDPVVQVLRPISPIAWFPFIVLWFGIGNLPAVVIIFIAAFYPILLSTISGVSKVDSTYLKVAQNFGVKQPYLLSKIIFPAAFPLITNGLYMALGSAWIFLVAGEMVGAQSGLGYLIIDARNSIRPDLVLAGMVSIGLTGLILDKTIRLLESWIIKQWGASSKR